MFDGLESQFTTVQVSVQAQNLFPPKFQPLVYNARDVPEAIDDANRPYRLTTVSIVVQFIYINNPWIFWMYKFCIISHWLTNLTAHSSFVWVRRVKLSRLSTENLFNLFFDGETFLTFLFFWKTFLNLFFYEKNFFFLGFLWKMYSFFVFSG